MYKVSLLIVSTVTVLCSLKKKSKGGICIINIANRYLIVSYVLLFNKNM